MHVSYEDISSHSIFGDKRLSKRFLPVLNSLETSINSNISQAQTNTAESVGFYRFMNNDHIMHDNIILTSHEVCQKQVALSDSSVILCINDTTEANYTGKPVASQLNCLSQVYQKGYFLHSQLLMTEQGLCIGLYHQEAFNRDSATLGDVRRKRTLSKKKSFEDRESYRWISGFKRLNTDFALQSDKTFVSISDRESDLFELIATPRESHIHYLYRAKFDRKVTTDEKLFTHIDKKAAKCIIKVEIPTKGNHHLKREATLEIRYQAVTFSANGYTSKNQEDKLATTNYIDIKEINAPIGVEPIHWRLVTSLPIDTLDQVLTVLKYYLLRWRIEEFHVILKQGCQIEELNFEEPRAILNLIASYSIVSTKILNFRYLYDCNPNAPIEILGYSVEDYYVLEKYFAHKTKTKWQKKQNPTAADFIMLVQKLGSGNKNAKKVGVRALWLGLGIVKTVLDVFYAFNEI